MNCNVIRNLHKCQREANVVLDIGWLSGDLQRQKKEDSEEPAKSFTVWLTGPRSTHLLSGGGRSYIFCTHDKCKISEKMSFLGEEDRVPERGKSLPVGSASTGEFLTLRNI